jgi:hypothetical protein
MSPLGLVMHATLSLENRETLVVLCATVIQSKNHLV